MLPNPFNESEYEDLFNPALDGQADDLGDRTPDYEAFDDDDEDWDDDDFDLDDIDDDDLADLDDIEDDESCGLEPGEGPDSVCNKCSGMKECWPEQAGDIPGTRKTVTPGVTPVCEPEAEPLCERVGDGVLLNMNAVILAIQDAWWKYQDTLRQNLTRQVLTTLDHPEAEEVPYTSGYAAKDRLAGLIACVVYETLESIYPIPRHVTQTVMDATRRAVAATL